MILSILGMYEYDPRLFDDMIIPVGMSKDILIDQILLECAELEVIFPDTNTLKRAIKVWSEAKRESWNKLYETVTIEYNPIWNVDADIEITRDTTGVNSVQGFNSSTWAEANKNEGDETIRERRQGNIGVTATQDLIKKEREIAEFSMYDHIAISFKNRFCILVY